MKYNKLCMLYTNKEQLPPSPPSLRDSLTHISYADRKHRQGGVPSSTSSKTPRSELANKVKRKICFALVNRNVYFAAAVDSFFHLQWCQARSATSSTSC